MEPKKITIVLIVVAVLVGIFTLWKLQSPTTPLVNAEWKKYENETIKYSFLYPASFTVYEHVIPEEDYYEVAIDDPATQSRYFHTRSYGGQSSIDDVSDYFTGPYPKQTEPSGILPNQTAVERIINGMKGVEVYGVGSGGHGYNDDFFYIAHGRLYVIALNPVIEAHAKAEEMEPGTVAPTESHREIYKTIMQSISI